MAYNEHLAHRIRKVLHEKRVVYEENKMMGGLCFMVAGKMCVGVEKDMLMARIDPNIYSHALRKKGCREMDFTGGPLKGFVYIESAGIDMDSDLEYWLQLSLDYNPRAKGSKRKA